MARKHIEFMFGGLMLILGAAFMIHTYDPAYEQMGIGALVSPIFYPRILLSAWLLLSVGILIEAAVKQKAAQKDYSWRNVLLMFMLIAVSIALMKIIGFLLASIIFFLGLS